MQTELAESRGLEELTPSPPAPWSVVFASFCALFIGTGTMTFTLGVFLRPVTEDLGISRGSFSSGSLLFAIASSLFCPLMGVALDHWGSRKILLPLILAFAIIVACLSRVPASMPVLAAMLGLAGLASAALTPVPYARAISLSFGARRGLALGIAIAGVGCGVALVPQIVGRVIASEGWRTAFVAYGAMAFVFAFVPVALFIGDRAHSSQYALVGSSEIAGLTRGEAMRTTTFWSMLVAFLAAVIAVNGTATHLVPLLIDRGLPTPTAIGAISIVGIAAILGRVACGWMLDRLSGPVVAAISLLIPIVGIALVSYGGTGPMPFAGAAMLGIALGAEVDVLAYFVGAYFGVRAFGVIYGTLFAVFGIGAGLGSFISGTAFDAFHSYTGIFAGYQALLAVACVLVLRLGPYKFAPHGTHALRS